MGKSSEAFEWWVVGSVSFVVVSFTHVFFLFLAKFQVKVYLVLSVPSSTGRGEAGRGESPSFILIINRRSAACSTTRHNSI
jgi:hypothetical protein